MEDNLNFKTMRKDLFNICIISEKYPDKKNECNNWYIKVDPAIWNAAYFERIKMPVDDLQRETLITNKLITVSSNSGRTFFKEALSRGSLDVKIILEKNLLKSF